MENLSHDEYIAGLRARAGQIAVAVAAGNLDLLEGCWSLGPLLAAAELGPGDADANAIGLVYSELDGLPLGDFRAHWAPEALARLAPELESLKDWATPLAMPAIESVARRFGA